MTSADPGSYAADLRLALDLAQQADAITLARFRAADLVVDAKPDHTPVTDADRSVEALIRRRLAGARPADAVLGEEEGQTGAGATRRWVLDPVDGTKNFARGVPVWATLLALQDGADFVVGVASAPALGRRWWAATGAGAFASDPTGTVRRLAVSTVGDLEQASLSYSSLGGWQPREPLLALADAVSRTRAYGDFWSHLLVAEGAVDIAAEPEVSLWDLAALAVIVREAGGRLTNLDGVDGPDGGSAVTTNGLLHPAVLALLRPVS